jgi:periplasmic protein CpxP/Spy
MKKPIILALFIACAAGSMAQDVQQERRTPEERAQAHTARMTKELGLTTEQAANVDAINRKYAAQTETMRTEQQQKRKTMREAHEAEMKAVLSPEQFATWQKKREEAKTKHMQRRMKRRAPPEPVEPKQ